MSRFYSVKFKLFYLISIIFSIFVGIDSYFDIYENNKQHVKYLSNLNKSTAKLIERNTNSDLYNLNYTKIKDTLSSFDNEYIDDIFILNKKGYIFAQRDMDKIQFKQYEGFNDLKNHSINKSNIFYKDISLGTKELGYLIIKNNIELFNKDKEDLQKQVIFRLAISLLIIFVVSYILSYIIVRPINKIINKLKTTKENERLNIDHVKKDEFGYLSKAIEDAYEKLYYLNKDLEDKVELEVQNSKDKDIILEKQALRASLGDIIDIVAHQWKQPLGVIRARSHELVILSQIQELTNDDILKSSQEIDKVIEHLVETLDEFRSFFRDNKITTNVLLKDIIESSYTLIKDDISLSNIIITITGDLNAKVSVIPEEFKHVIINLIGNTKDAFVEHDIKNRNIDFNILINKDKAILKVCDNAGGIPQNIIKNIFDVNFTTKSDDKGTGMGLYMSKMFLEKREATISVENTKDGACFIITLPLYMP